MKSRLSVSAIFLMSFSLSFHIPLFAGTLDPSLNAKLETLPRGNHIDALIFLSDRVDTKMLLSSLEGAPSLELRHSEVVRALTQKATLTQAPLLGYLESQKGLGRVSEYRPFWITNMIAVAATRGVIEEIALRFDVEWVYEDFAVIHYEPVSTGPARSGLAGHEPGLGYIKADSLWAMGITGEGVLVCNIDTGVEGTHEALAARWRGLDPGVSWWEAWYDPITADTIPFDDDGHGTHTMGTMTGRSETDTIGVAPDAKWIAAGVIGRAGADSTRFAVYASAFEWAADPDSNPDTFEDVPDVISNSWGINSDLPACNERFWEVIDNCEAAGSIVLFAAGNEGQEGPGSLRNPADRNTTPLNVMAVGATEADSVIAYFSSRGPSTCDDETRKPEVCAPGVNIRSSYKGNQYRSFDGTSMACPHVAGAAALLRQVDPGAPPELVKEALLLSTREATWDNIPGEDNAYGMGFIDCASAYRYLLALCTFADISSSSGIETGGDGRGCAWGDYDGDGDDDLYVTNHGDDRLFRNDPWTFTEVASEVGITGAWNSYAACWIDYDRDRDLDLFVAVSQGNNKLFRNEGGVFTDVSDIVGAISSEYANSRDAAWLDYNLDGWPDLYVVNQNMDNKLYRNEAGTFVDVTEAMGLAALGGEGIGIADYDDDGDPDIYTCYSGYPHPNTLHRNDRTTFTDVTEEAGVGADSAASYGCAWGDYDSDEDLDLYVCNGIGGNILYRNDGGIFADVSRYSCVNDQGASRAATWMDYDNDADLDLFVTNWTASSLYLNTGEGTFLEVSRTREIEASHGVGTATSDFDNDGDLDLFVVRQSGEDDRLYRNEGSQNNWLAVSLRGDFSDRYGIGARAVVSSGGVSMVREIAGGNTFYSQDSYVLHFGLGSETVADLVEVRWPSGRTSVLQEVAANQRIVIKEIPRQRTMRRF